MVFTETPLHPVSDDNPAVQLDARQLSDLIRQLPTGFQTIFNLYAIEGYTHAEIGQMLGISDGTSKSQYARARYLLIEWVEKYSSLPKTCSTALLCCEFMIVAFRSAKVASNRATFAEQKSTLFVAKSIRSQPSRSVNHGTECRASIN